MGTGRNLHIQVHNDTCNLSRITWLKKNNIMALIIHLYLGPTNVLGHRFFFPHFFFVVFSPICVISTACVTSRHDFSHQLGKDLRKYFYYAKKRYTYYYYYYSFVLKIIVPITKRKLVICIHSAYFADV